MSELADALKVTAPATADAALASASGYIVKPDGYEALVSLVHHLQVGWESQMRDHEQNIHFYNRSI